MPDQPVIASAGDHRALRTQLVGDEFECRVPVIIEAADQVRVELSNEYGAQPLVIGAAHVALAGENGAIQPGSDRALTFGGRPSITVPPGAPVLSDPVELTVADLGSLAVSLFLPEITPARADAPRARRSVRPWTASGPVSNSGSTSSGYADQRVGISAMARIPMGTWRLVSSPLRTPALIQGAAVIVPR